MAMVIIKNGSKKMKVSYGAFVGMYKRAGWELANVSAAKKYGEGNKSSSDAYDEQNQDAKQEKDEWDEADEELAKETNVDKMDFNELKKLAVSKGINAKGIKTIGELRKAIKEVK